MSGWDEWIGRTETRTDRVDDSRLSKWLSTFDRTPPPDGTAPQGFHWCLCTPDEATARLGPDGHPRRDTPESFLPPIPLPRRMWASGAVEFHRPLRLSDRVERVSTILAVESKAGASGELVFVSVQHDLRAGSDLAVRERQTLVYRGEGAPRSAVEPHSLTTQRTICPDEALLFRYSALTFNSHRIHYDGPYATGEEGYRGLVVHGPLTATLLLDLARRDIGDNRLTRFAFRGVAPAIAGEPLRLGMARNGTVLAFEASNDAGAVMRAEGTLAD